MKQTFSVRNPPLHSNIKTLSMYALERDFKMNI